MINRFRAMPGEMRAMSALSVVFIVVAVITLVVTGVDGTSLLFMGLSLGVSLTIAAWNASRRSAPRG